ncbi:trehalose-phosphatase [Ramlibacter sp.]|uniref:trehalose-phosphatase n=1 Tax=Ramlibacter sp. TaxID=1917967 RepID=UPI0035AFFDCF
MMLPIALSGDAALFLDFDGTLVDIAAAPEAVRVPPGLVASLGRLADRLDGALALVSGRPVSELDTLLAPLRLPAAGVHGAERRDASGHLARIASPDAALAEVAAAAAALSARHPALRVEHKRGAIALHYRQAPDLAQLCHRTLAKVVAGAPGLRLQQGKQVVEALAGSVDKGRAVRDFLDEPPFRGRRPVYIGDDHTDEAGFAAAQAAGGLGFKVGDGPSAARGRIPDPDAVRQALAALAWSHA